MNFSAEASFNTAARESDAFNRYFTTEDVKNPTTLAVSTRTDSGDRPDERPSIATLSVGDTRSPGARSARRIACHTLLYYYGGP